MVSTPNLGSWKGHWPKVRGISWDHFCTHVDLDLVSLEYAQISWESTNMTFEVQWIQVDVMIQLHSYLNQAHVINHAARAQPRSVAIVLDIAIKIPIFECKILLGDIGDIGLKTKTGEFK